MAGRPSKPVAANKKHLTNAEKEQREHFEQALLSGKKISERKRARGDDVAHAEFRRVLALMKAIGKDDALYSEQITDTQNSTLRRSSTRTLRILCATNCRFCPRSREKSGRLFRKPPMCAIRLMRIPPRLCVQTLKRLWRLITNL